LWCRELPAKVTFCSWSPELQKKRKLQEISSAGCLVALSPSLYSIPLPKPFQKSSFLLLLTLVAEVSPSVIKPRAVKFIL
jgi:hypothetical protein